LPLGLVELGVERPHPSLGLLERGPQLGQLDVPAQELSNDMEPIRN
jgi:hypothetical protein